CKYHALIMIEFNLHIKNMVCPRCIEVVRDELGAVGAEVLQVELGHARIRCNTSKIQINSMSKIFEMQGLELIEDEDDMLLEKIKINLISYLTHIENNKEYESLSLYMSRKMGKNYCSISRHFSRNMDKTIEKHFIHLKIERVKELIDYNELTLSQIALK